jgi:hypothetical protein
MTLGLGVAALVAMLTTPAALLAAQSGWATYTDPRGQFTFRYPAEWGQPSEGSDAGFEERVATVRFAAVNADVVLNRGVVRLDHQAAGGLYDHFSLQALPLRTRPQIEAALPRLTAGTFCAQLAADHASTLALPVDLRAVARAVDRLQYVDPRVEVCESSGEVIRFSRTAAVSDAAGAPRPYVYGAVRFLSGSNGSFQIVARSAQAPPAAALDAMRRVVESFSPGLSPSATARRPADGVFRSQ